MPIYGAALMAGGSGPAFAAIGAIYPVGAVCTCSYNGQTLTAKDTSGRALFLVPSAGQWLVKATNGGQEVEDTVSITTQGQVASVTLSYWDGTIFDNGNQYTDITGGWTGVSNKKLVSSNGVAWVSNKAVSVKDFNTIHFVVDTYTFNGNGANGWLGLYDTKSPSDNDESVAHLVIGSSGTYTIDVSSLTGSYYIRGNVSKWDRYYGTEIVSKIWLT